MGPTAGRAIQNCTLYDTKRLGEKVKLSKCQGKKGADSALYIMDEKETEQFKHLQETLGTILFALNCHGWSREDRATLLRCNDCLERKLIDIKHGVCREKGR